MMVKWAEVLVRRVYATPARCDGTRVLVDRIWPRGLTKAKAGLDEWCKQVAPSTELRKWYSTTRPGLRSSPAVTTAS
jgi:uncharacterized protein YeaO (DUF488 family)